MKKLAIILLLIPFGLFSQGMWQPHLLKKQNEKEMKSLGMKISAEDIYSIKDPSLKDAICLFGGGCTGEMISGEGLLLTNHHCGFDAIADLSTLEHNYVDDGFWAKNKSEELPAKGVTATFVTRMEDVTILALDQVTELMTESARQAQIDKNLAKIKANTAKEAYEDISIRPFYNGNQYVLFVVTTYKDLRLVGTPPSSIGKFGSDTDNWVWPRHTGDFSLFRVYADAQNKPAAYAPSNVPYKPKKFLSISMDGVHEEDFTMVYGFPGRTDEYLTEAAVKQTGELIDPARVSIRDQVLKIMDGFIRKDPATKIAYVAKYASIANAWKKWKGEMLGLKNYHGFEKKQQYEAEFTSRVKANADLSRKYGALLPRLNEAYKNLDPYLFAREFYSETMVRNNEVLGLTANLSSWINTYTENGPGFFGSKVKENASLLEKFYENYHPEVDQAIFSALMELYGTQVKPEWGAGFVADQAKKYGGYDKLAESLFTTSVIPNKAKMDALLKQDASVIYTTLQTDPMYTFWKSVNEPYTKEVMPKTQEYAQQIAMLQRIYMGAQLEVFKEKRFFPDANSTLRVTYGKVKAFRPKDGVIYDHQTYLDGVMEKYIPGDYEFDVPQKLISLYKNKDFGPYAAPDGRMPVAFIGTNHTTGGNSGSPALDAYGNLIGLNFDRVWEGTMSDLNYDAAICRNIMVDARYVLFIIDKYAGAGYLVKEMNLVKGKRKAKKKSCK